MATPLIHNTNNIFIVATMLVKRVYIRPSVERIGMVSPRQNLLSSSSLGGDFVDFEDDGTIEDWTIEEAI